MLLGDEVSAAARANTGGVLVLRMGYASQSSGTLWNVSVRDGMVSVFCPSRLVVVLEARISFYEGSKGKQADYSGEPVAAHANGGGCAAASVSVPVDDSTLGGLPRVLVRLF